MARRGELVAKQRLESKGYKIWDTNWRCPIGELDIVASYRRELIFIEVKTRSVNKAFKVDPVTAVDFTKQQKLLALGHWYRRQQSKKIKRAGIRAFRFDIMALTAELDRGHRTLNCEHIQDVFLNS